MVAWREKFPFDFVVMLGDNIYPPHAADDFVTEVRRALPRAARCRGDILRRDRQPRSVERAGLPGVQHGGAPLLLVQA